LVPSIHCQPIVTHSQHNNPLPHPPRECGYEKPGHQREAQEKPVHFIPALQLLELELLDPSAGENYKEEREARERKREKERERE
jgi:hypothetical protein